MRRIFAAAVVPLLVPTALVASMGSAAAQASCQSPYGLSIDVPKPWRTFWCAKEDLLRKQTKYPSSYAFQVINDESGFRFDLVVKEPARDYPRVKFVTEQIARYATGPNKIQYNFRPLGDEDVEVKETEAIKGVTYDVSYQTYSINETNGIVRHKRTVAFIFFKYEGYEAYGFVRLVADKTWTPPGKTFTANEHPREQVKALLAGLSSR